MTGQTWDEPHDEEEWDADSAVNLMRDEELSRAVIGYWNADDGDYPEAHYHLFAVIADRIGHAHDDGFKAGLEWQRIAEAGKP